MCFIPGFYSPTPSFDRTIAQIFASDQWPTGATTQITADSPAGAAEIAARETSAADVKLSRDADRGPFAIGERLRDLASAAAPATGVMRPARRSKMPSGIWLSPALTASVSCCRLRLLNRKRACKPKRAEQGTKMSGQAAAGHATRWHDPPSARSRQNPRRAPEPPSLIRELAIHGLCLTQLAARIVQTQSGQRCVPPREVSVGPHK